MSHPSETPTPAASIGGRLWRGSFLVYAARILARVGTLSANIAIVRILDIERVGQLGLFESWLSLATIFTLIGLTAAVTKHVAHDFEVDPRRAGGTAGAALLLLSVPSVVETPAVIAKPEPPYLELPTVLNGFLRRGEVLSFRLRLKQGEAVSMVLRSAREDLAVCLLAPSGVELFRVDSGNGLRDVEMLYALSGVAGDYLLEVRSGVSEWRVTRYQLEISQPRPASERGRLQGDPRHRVALVGIGVRQVHPAGGPLALLRAVLHEGWPSPGARQPAHALPDR